MTEILIILFLAAAAVGLSLFLIGYVMLSVDKYFQDRRRMRLSFIGVALLAAGWAVPGVSITTANAQGIPTHVYDYRKSAGRLFEAYKRYVGVSLCHVERLAINDKRIIGDIDIERAKNAVMVITARSTAEDASIDTDKVWQDAVAALSNNGTPAAAICEWYMQEFLFPTPVYAIPKP